MSVSRLVIAEVNEVPEEHVKCGTCLLFVDGVCKGWNCRVRNRQDDFCSFWCDRKENKGEEE